MSKYSRQDYRDIGKLIGKAHVPKSSVDAWVRKFKKDNPRFKSTLFRAWVKKHR